MGRIAKGFVVAIVMVVVAGFLVVVVAIASCVSGSGAKLQGNDNRTKIYNFWISQGYTPKTAAGITASIKHESGYSAFRQEMSETWPNGGYAIAQFTGGQRKAVIEHMVPMVGKDVFEAYYKPEYGDAVHAENGYIPEGVPQKVNDAFLEAQLSYLSKYISGFAPSDIPLRPLKFMILTGLAVPSSSTLHEYLLSIDDERTAAIAWTFLYEYPGNINSTAMARADTATELYAELTGQGGGASMQTAGSRTGACVTSASTASWAGGELAPPLNGDMEINSLYGDTSVGLRTKPHQGIDLVGSYGIQSVAAGTVTFAGWNDGGYGNRIEIDHGNGFVSTYSHMASFEGNIREGATVAAGQRLGIMGTTGKSTGDHLHFEVWLDDKPVDPEKFLAEHGMPIPREDGIGPSPYVAQAMVWGGAFEHHVSLQTAQQPPLSAAEQSRVAASLSHQSSLAAMRLLHPLRKKGVFYFLNVITN